MDSTGSKNNVRAIGSSISYGKRYAASALLNITTRGEDDDGKAGGAKPVSDEQRAELQDLIEKSNTEIEAFCRAFSVDALVDLPSAAFDRAASMLRQKIIRGTPK